MGTELERTAPSVALAAMQRPSEGRRRCSSPSAPERAARDPQPLRTAEVEVLSLEMAELQGVDAATTEGVLDELADGVDWPRPASCPAASTTPARCSSAWSARTAPRRSSARLAASGEFRPFEFLRRTPPEQIVTFLADEAAADDRARRRLPAHRPQRPRAGASCPAELQAEVALRIAHDGRDEPGGRRATSRPGCARSCRRSRRRSTPRRAASQSLAEILNSAGRSTERNVLDGLATLDADAGRRGPACCCSPSRTSSSSTTARSS